MSGTGSSSRESGVGRRVRTGVESDGVSQDPLIGGGMADGHADGHQSVNQQIAEAFIHENRPV